MTIRSFWFAFFTYVTFFAVMILCAFTFGQASTPYGGNLTIEEQYVLMIESLETTPFFSLMPKGDYPDFESLIKQGTPNLIVRVTLEERMDALVYDPHGCYNDQMLEDAALAVKNNPRFKHKAFPEHEAADGHVYSWNDDVAYEKAENISFYISTPYIAHVEDVLLGDAIDIGEEFTFYAPYGIIGDFYIRYDDCPIFMAGREYVLFFSIVDIEETGRWYDLVHPAAACEITIEDPQMFSDMSFAGEAMFSEAGWDYYTLKDLIEVYYNESPYPIDVPEIPRMTPGTIYDIW